MQLAPGWTVDLDRGPDWLFVRLHADDVFQASRMDLCENLWELMRCHMANRIVIELDDLPLLSSYLIGQIVLLNKRVHSRGGIMRLCGLSETSLATLRASRLDTLLPAYADRESAVMGFRPAQPR